MSKNKPAPNNNPFCCGERSTWVDNGKWLQYFYCKICKKEVEDKGNGWKDYEPPDYGFSSEMITLPPGYTISSNVFLGGLTTPKPSPTRIDYTSELVDVSGPSPCSAQPPIHNWHGITSYDMGIPCNCGLRVK